MTINYQPSPILRTLFVGASLVIVIAGMKAAASILVVVLLALLLSILFTPIAGWLGKKGLPPKLALIITILGVIIGILLLVAFVGASIAKLALSISAYASPAEARKESLQTLLANGGIDAEQILSALLQPGKWLEAIAVALGNVIGSLGSTVFVLLLLVFMLLDASNFSTRLRMDLRPDSPLLAQVGKFTKDIREYVWISTWINLLIGIINTVFLLFLGVDFALLWGLLSFILGYIQGIGVWLALIPPFLLALLEFGPGKALLVLAGYLVINALIRNLVQPRFMGKGLDLSPLVVVLSLFFWGWVLGPVGVLLSIPLTMMVKDILLESGDDARWLADLMGQGEIPDREPADDA